MSRVIWLEVWGAVVKPGREVLTWFEVFDVKIERENACDDETHELLSLGLDDIWMKLKYPRQSSPARLQQLYHAGVGAPV